MDPVDIRITVECDQVRVYVEQTVKTSWRG